jgi:hypothetical protein
MDELDDFPAAMNQSIYLMLGVPYAALIIVGFMIYRGMKKNDAFVQAMCEGSAIPIHSSNAIRS